MKPGEVVWGMLSLHSGVSSCAPPALSLPHGWPLQPSSSPRGLFAEGEVEIGVGAPWNCPSHHAVRMTHSALGAISSVTSCSAR